MHKLRVSREIWVYNAAESELYECVDCLFPSMGGVYVHTRTHTYMQTLVCFLLQCVGQKKKDLDKQHAHTLTHTHTNTHKRTLCRPGNTHWINEVLKCDS